MLFSFLQNKNRKFYNSRPLLIYLSVFQARRQGKARGAIAFALIFFVSFLHQGKKENNSY
jgi:hypothetical protein